MSYKSFALISDLHSFVHLSRDEIHNDRSQKTVETTQPQRPGTLQQQQQHSQRHGMTSLSMEEQKILLSLDRLNHQLHCEHILTDRLLSLVRY